MAQLVARLTGGQEAAGSSPVTRTKTLETAMFQGFLLSLQNNQGLLIFGVSSKNPVASHCKKAGIII